MGCGSTQHAAAPAPQFMQSSGPKKPGAIKGFLEPTDDLDKKGTSIAAHQKINKAEAADRQQREATISALKNADKVLAAQQTQKKRVSFAGEVPTTDDKKAACTLADILQAAVEQAMSDTLVDDGCLVKQPESGSCAKAAESNMSVHVLKTSGEDTAESDGAECSQLLPAEDQKVVVLEETATEAAAQGVIQSSVQSAQPDTPVADSNAEGPAQDPATLVAVSNGECLPQPMPTSGATADGSSASNASPSSSSKPEHGKLSETQTQTSEHIVCEPLVSNATPSCSSTSTPAELPEARPQVAPDAIGAAPHGASVSNASPAGSSKSKHKELPAMQPRTSEIFGSTLQGDASGDLPVASSRTAPELQDKSSLESNTVASNVAAPTFMEQLTTLGITPRTMPSEHAASSPSQSDITSGSAHASRSSSKHHEKREKQQRASEHTGAESPFPLHTKHKLHAETDLVHRSSLPAPSHASLKPLSKPRRLTMPPPTEESGGKSLGQRHSRQAADLALLGVTAAEISASSLSKVKKRKMPSQVMTPDALQEIASRQMEMSLPPRPDAATNLGRDNKAAETTEADAQCRAGAKNELGEVAQPCAASNGTRCEEVAATAPGKALPLPVDKAPCGAKSVSREVRPSTAEKSHVMASAGLGKRKSSLPSPSEVPVTGASSVATGSKGKRNKEAKAVCEESGKEGAATEAMRPTPSAGSAAPRKTEATATQEVVTPAAKGQSTGSNNAQGERATHSAADQSTAQNAGAHRSAAELAASPKPAGIERSADVAKSALRALADGSPTRQPAAVKPAGKTFEFRVVIHRGSRKLGLEAETDPTGNDSLMVLAVHDGPVMEWNIANPTLKIQKGDQIKEVNGTAGSAYQIVPLLKVADPLKLLISRPLKE